MADNPYLLLGIDYGDPPSAARRAFAGAVRRMRRSVGSTVSLEDLNEALYAVQSAEGDPFDDVSIYRVPADPSAFRARGDGVLRPAPRALPRTTSPVDPTALRPRAASEMSDVLDVVIAATTTFDEGYRFDEGGSG